MEENYEERRLKEFNQLECNRNTLCNCFLLGMDDLSPFIEYIKSKHSLCIQDVSIVHYAQEYSQLHPDYFKIKPTEHVDVIGQHKSVRDALKFDIDLFDKEVESLLNGQGIDVKMIKDVRKHLRNLINYVKEDFD